MTTQVLVYSTDAWHTHDSKTLVGIFNKKSTAINKLKKAAKLDEEAVEELERSNQTQGRETNFMLDECHTGTLNLNGI